MSTAKNLMITDLISVDPDDSVETAISLMLKHGLSGLPVVDTSGRLLGVVSEFDLLELVWDPHTSQDKVYHHMTREVHTVAEDDQLATVAERFRMFSIQRLPVMRGDRLVGMIGRNDLLRHVLQLRGRIAPVVPRLLSPIDTPSQSPVSF